MQIGGWIACSIFKCSGFNDFFLKNFSGPFTLICLITAGEYILFLVLLTSAKSLEHSHANREKQRNIWCIFMTFPAVLIAPIFCHYQSSCSKLLISSVSQCHIVRAFWIFQTRQTWWKDNTLRLMCTNLEGSGYPPRCLLYPVLHCPEILRIPPLTSKYSWTKIIVKMTSITFSRTVVMIEEEPYRPQWENSCFLCRRSQEQIPGISTLRTR